MTLTVTLINRHGIWQSSDLRICDPRTKTLVDDYSIKHVGFRCPDGAALVTYAGVGRVKDVHLSDWIRQFVRGESYTVDQTLIQIRQRATEDLGELLLEKQIPHMFSIGAFLNGMPWVAQIRTFSFHMGISQARPGRAELPDSRCQNTGGNCGPLATDTPER